MYNVLHRYILLEIPKNGSRSLVQACLDHHGKKWVKGQGHHTLEEYFTSIFPIQVEAERRPDYPVRVYAVFRNPMLRFVSQVNQAWRKKSGLTLNDIMNVAWAQSDIVFKPQSSFVRTGGDWEIDLRMWDMERIDTAASYIIHEHGGKEKVHYHKNRDPGSCPFSTDQILDHRLFDDIFDEHYQEDFKWWLRAQKTNDEGKEP